MDSASNNRRYDRQVNFAAFGPEGQRRLAAGRALVVGVGGLGCVTAELLARGGVGFLRLVDPDAVAAENLHRQILFDQRDADQQTPKVHAAAARLAAINPALRVEPIVASLGASNVAALAEGVDVIVDGTDNFGARFIINDFAVSTSLPWVFAGAVGAEGQTMTIVPGQTPCLRCVFDRPPPPCQEPTCRIAGVLAPAVVAIAAIQAMEALKILAGRREAVSPFLWKMDLWACTLQRIDVLAAAGGVDCPCCKRRDFEFLNG
jgi:adenylyltransferase/sulfurtransferase